jgi:hypothetical protein
MFASCGFRACTVEMLLATNETDQRMIS